MTVRGRGARKLSGCLLHDLKAFERWLAMAPAKS